MGASCQSIPAALPAVDGAYAANLLHGTYRRFALSSRTEVEECANEQCIHDGHQSHDLPTRRAAPACPTEPSREDEALALGARTHSSKPCDVHHVQSADSSGFGCEGNRGHCGLRAFMSPSIMPPMAFAACNRHSSIVRIVPISPAQGGRCQHPTRRGPRPQWINTHTRSTEVTVSGCVMAWPTLIMHNSHPAPVAVALAAGDQTALRKSIKCIAQRLDHVWRGEARLEESMCYRQ